MAVQKVGEKMAPTMGRPPVDNPKSERLQIRVDKGTIELLDECAERKGTNRSEIIREGIQLMKEQLDGKKK
jgi:metal-responsive CopG/Arc/MetJ family transcriptional regulator